MGRACVAAIGRRGMRRTLGGPTLRWRAVAVAIFALVALHSIPHAHAQDAAAAAPPSDNTAETPAQPQQPPIAQPAAPPAPVAAAAAAIEETVIEVVPPPPEPVQAQAAPAPPAPPVEAPPAAPAPVEKKTTRGDFSTIARKIKELEEQNKRLHEEVVTIETTAVAEAAEKESQIKQLEEDMRRYMAESQAKGEEIQQVKGQLGERSAQLDERSKQLEERSKQLEIANKDLGDARTKVAALMIVQEDLMKQKENLHMTYAELRAKYDNPELQHYVTQRASALLESNPGLHGAVNKSSQLIFPVLEASKEQYAVIFNSTQFAIKSSIHPFLGSHSHFISGFVSYALFFVPLFCSVYCLVSVRAILQLRSMILFCHLYFSICSLVAALFTLYLRSDPLRLLQEQNAGTYIFTQLLLGILYLMYFVLQCLALCQSKALDVWVSRVVQLLAVTVIGGLYYATVFTPAMLDKPPMLISTRGLLIFYGIPAFVFGIMLFIEKASGPDLGTGKHHDFGKDDMEIVLTSKSGLSQVGDLPGASALQSAMQQMLPGAALRDEEMGKEA